METGSGADTSGCGDVATGNAASGVSDAVGVGAGDTSSGGVGDAAYCVPKTIGDKLRLNCICQSVILLKKTAFLGVENSRFERE